jgi:hypothetical protein
MPNHLVQAGFATADFTPEPGLTLLGQMHERRGERVRDPLLASAVALRSETETVVIVSVDICLLTRNFVDETQQQFARGTGQPARSLLLHATHTHVAPSAVDLLAARAEPGFVEQLRSAILRAAEGALSHLEPVELFAGTGHLEQMGWNRRAMFADGHSRMYGHAGMPGFIGMEGPRDSTLGVLFVRSQSGDLRGLVVSFSTHPNAIEGDCVYSGDIPGEVRRVLRGLWGPEVVIVYLTGAAGNTAPSMLDPYVPDQPWRGETGLKRSGLYLAGEVIKVIASCLAPMASPALRLEQAELAIPVRPWPQPDEPTYPEPLASDAWSAARPYYESAAADWSRRHAQENPVPVRLNLLRVGDAAICTNPAELFVEYGLRIRQRSPARVTLIAELTDGYAGYVPTVRAFDRGGYETWPAPSSQLVPEAGERIVRATRRLLKTAFGP